MRFRIAALAFASVALMPLSGQAAVDTGTLIKKGEYVARASDCMACHTGNDGTPYAGGYAISSPMGAIFATNISPSKSYGIGNWTETQFADAVRKGVSPNGHLYPAMPYTAYAGMSDADIHALYVYMMQGVKAVDRAPKIKTSLPFPFNQRLLMAGWNLMFAGGEPMDAAKTQPGGSQRGEYLVKVLEHCSTCHTPRNAMMAEQNSRFLTGADLGGWHAPNITSDPISGIGGWSREDLINYLRNGSAHGKSQAAGAMAEAVEHSLRFLDDADLAAIADYLKTVPAVRDPSQTEAGFATTNAKPVDIATFDKPIDRSPDAMRNGTSTNGQELYAGACASCHQLKGEGTQDQFYPSLTANTATGGVISENLVMAILHGIHRATNHDVVAMPAFADELNDAQIASVANYVFSNFGNAKLSVTEQQVTTLRNGTGHRPLLVTMAPVASIAGIIFVILIVVGSLFAFTRRKRA
ncbi:cytochrome c [Gluconobacter kanchanaburiensis]|nr:cytochrome c [Gluconobacter kanchanaburiensis]